MFFKYFVDDPSPYKCGLTLNEVMNNLEITTKKCLNGSVSTA